MANSKESDPLLTKDPTKNSEENQVPRKTRWLIYMLMMLFGLASLLPWNMVITATGYFAAKFAETQSSTIEEGFPSYFQIGGIASNVAVSLSSIVLFKYLPIKPVLITCNTLALVIFIVMTVMAKLSTTTWPMVFFILSNVLFCLVCCMSSAYTSGMMSMASMILPSTVQGFILGQGTAGLVSTLLSIMTLSFPGINPVDAGFYYFLIATTILSAALVAFILFTKMDFVQKSTLRSQEIERFRASSSASTISANLEKPEISAHAIFMRIVKYNLTSFTTLLITLACFPAALSALRTTQTTNLNSTWNQTYFQPVMTFLLFNIGDVLGRITSGVVTLPSKRWILPISLLRIVFIPLIYMCNLQPRSIPVWFTADIWPGVFSILISWTNGHILSLAASYCPQEVTKSSEKSLAGSFSAFSSALGLVIGSLLVFPLLRIIK